MASVIRTPSVVLSANSAATTASRRSGPASAVTETPGRPFFMMTGVRKASRAPAASNRSTRWGAISGGRSSRVASTISSGSVGGAAAA